MQFFIKTIKGKSAQAMIEFAFVLPVLMLIFVFIFDGAQLMYGKQVTHNACVYTCRQLTVEGIPKTGANEEYFQKMARDLLKDQITQGIGMRIEETLNKKPLSLVYLDSANDKGYSTFDVANNKFLSYWKATTSNRGPIFLHCQVVATIDLLFPINGGETDYVTNQTLMIKEYTQPRNNMFQHEPEE